MPDFISLMKFVKKNFDIYFCLHRFPFNRKNLIGYLITVALEFIVIKYFAFFMGSVAALGVGSYLVVAALVRDTYYCLQLINTSSEDKKNRSKAVKSLAEFIEMQSMLKKLSKSYFLNPHLVIDIQI